MNDENLNTTQMVLDESVSNSIDQIVIVKIVYSCKFPRLELSKTLVKKKAFFVTIPVWKLNCLQEYRAYSFDKTLSPIVNIEALVNLRVFKLRN